MIAAVAPWRCGAARPDQGLVLDPSPPSSLAFVFSGVREREVMAMVVAFVDALVADYPLPHY